MPSSSSVALLDGALGERARGGDLAADEERQRVRRRVAQHGDRGLELAEAVRDRRGGIGGDQQRMVDAVRDVRLDRRGPAHPHLLHRLEDLDGGEKRERRRDLGGRHARGQPRDLGARDRRDRRAIRANSTVSSAIASSATDRSMPVAGDELVDQVELLLGLAVELDHAAVLDPRGTARGRRGSRTRRGRAPDPRARGCRG